MYAQFTFCVQEQIEGRQRYDVGFVTFSLQVCLDVKLVSVLLTLDLTRIPDNFTDVILLFLLLILNILHNFFQRFCC